MCVLCEGQSKAKGLPFLRVYTDLNPLVFEFQNEKVRDGIWDIVQSLVPAGQGQKATDSHAERGKGGGSQKDANAKKQLLENNK